MGIELKMFFPKKEKPDMVKKAAIIGPLIIVPCFFARRILINVNKPLFKKALPRLPIAK